MKALGLRGAAGAVAVAAWMALAPNAAAQLKIAVVNTGQAIQQSEEATAYFAGIEGELKPEQDELVALQASIRDLQKKLADEGSVMADADRRKAAKEIEDKRIDLEFRAQKLQKEFQDHQQELGQIMGPKVQAVINDLIELERYDVVLDRGSVLFVNPRHNITAKVTEKLNERYAESNPATN